MKKHSFWITILLVAVFSLVSQGAWANHNGPHYGKVTATAKGMGKVYASTSSTAPTDAQWSDTKSESEVWKCGNQTTSSDSHTYYLFAKPSLGYTFRGWFDNEACTGNPLSTNNPYGVSFSASSTNQSSPTTKSYYAKFEKVDLPENGSFTNPILPNDAADPAVILAEDGYFYMYSSEHYSGEGIVVWRSSDMINWTRITTVFAERPTNVSYTFLWAPEIVYLNGKYLLYYANAAWGEEANTQICVASSDKPYGPFTDNKILIRAHDANYGALNANLDNNIDPSFFEADGKKYLVWGSWHGIHYVELSDDGMSLAKMEKKAIATGTSGDWTKIEAPMVVKHGDYFYLVCSKGTTVTDSPTERNITYQLAVARTTTLGGQLSNKNGQNPFSNGRTMTDLLKSNSVVLGPGHCSRIVKDFKGQEWLFYHGYAKKNSEWDFNTGRVLFASKVTWGSDGWPIVEEPTTLPIDMPAVDPVGPMSYEIMSADDLVDFAAKVNAGESFANATLCNDIDCQGINWTPIGTESNPFRGEINGQGFSIKNLTINTSANNQGLIGWANGGAHIKDLIIDASCSITGGSYTAAFIGHAKGSGSILFERCGNEALITGLKNTAGFMGCSEGVSIYWEDCYNMGDIHGNNESAAFSGWGADRLRNCWNTGRTLGCEGAGGGYWFSMARNINENNYINTYDLNSENAPLEKNRLAGYETSWMTNGKLCYTLNEGAGRYAWYQNIDDIFGENKDSHPVFLSSHKVVFFENGTYHNFKNEAEKENTQKTISGYTQTGLNEGEYYTLCLPYASAEYTGATFYSVVGVTKEDDHITGIVLEEQDSESPLEAGKPYVFKATANELNVTYQGLPVLSKVGRATGMVGNLTADKIQVPEGMYFLRTANAIARTTTTVKATIRTNRAYFDLTNVEEYNPASLVREAIIFGVEGEDDPDAIDNVTIVKREDNAVYNVMGQRVNAGAKGLLIKNGKKVLVK